MMNLLMLITIIFFISNIMMLLSILLSKKTLLDREKCSPFECGFNPKQSSRIPFSLHFFLITMIFLIFDVEITLMLPMIKSFMTTKLLNWLLTTTFFIMILLIGLYHEWNQNMLNWHN